MWEGKRKAVTFSYDDGVEQDRKLIELFNYYHVKGTFNLNSGLMSKGNTWNNKGLIVKHMNYQGLRELYQGHEIAGHGLSHVSLPDYETDTIKSEVFLDKRNLENLFGQKVDGFAYPFGTYNYDTKKVLHACGFQYARVVERSGNFELPEEMLCLKPTCHHDDKDTMQLVDRFIEMKTEKPQLLYVWGHSYEFDEKNNWKRMEDILEHLSKADDIFYGTNSAVLLEK